MTVGPEELEPSGITADLSRPASMAASRRSTVVDDGSGLALLSIALKLQQPREPRTPRSSNSMPAALPARLSLATRASGSSYGVPDRPRAPHIPFSRSMKFQLDQLGVEPDGAAPPVNPLLRSKSEPLRSLGSPLGRSISLPGGGSGAAAGAMLLGDLHSPGPSAERKEEEEEDLPEGEPIEFLLISTEEGLLKSDIRKDM